MTFRAMLIAAAMAVATVGLADGPVTIFSRSCYVVDQPSNKAAQVCAKKQDEPVLKRETIGNGWVQIETGDCNGFVAEECLAPVPLRVAADAHFRRNTIRLAFQAHFNGNLGSAAGDSSRGDGWGIQFRLQVPVTERLRLSFTPTYQTLGLTRSIDMTGALKDPNPVQFTQTIKYLGAGISADYVVLRNFEQKRITLDPELAVEIGTEFLIPVSARQDDSVTGNSVSFTTSNKLLLLFLGGTLDVAMSDHASVLLYLNGYYNLGATSGNSLLGGRLGLGMAYAF